MTLVEMGMQKLHRAPTEPYDASDLTELRDRLDAFESRPTLLFTTRPSAPEKALARIYRWHEGHLGSSYGDDPVNRGFGVSHSESEKSPQKVYKECHGNTHGIDFQLSTVDTNGLQDLLDFAQETYVKDWTSELNVTEMPWALCHTLATSRTFEVTVYCPHSWISQTTFFLLLLFVHDFWKLDLCDRVRFDFIWGKDSKLNFFDLAYGSYRLSELVTKHGRLRERMDNGHKSESLFESFKIFLTS